MADDPNVVVESPDVHFEPIMKLPLVETKTLEEDEEVLFKIRAKLYRYDSSPECKLWKERGTGEIKILKHRRCNTVRILMRRDKTLKICANHYVRPYMRLEPNNNSNRAWVWKTLADFADEEPKPELLAVKFANPENAKLFKDAFEEALQIVGKQESADSDSGQDSDSENEENVSSKSVTDTEKKEEKDEKEDEGEKEKREEEKEEKRIEEVAEKAVSNEEKQDTLSNQFEKLSVVNESSSKDEVPVSE